MDTAIIFWHIFFLILGFLLGNLVGGRMARRAAPPVATAAPESQPVQAADAARLKAGRGPGGKVWVELDGKALPPGQKLEPEQQRDLSALLLEMRPWLMGEPLAKPVEPAAPAPRPAAPVTPVPLKPVKQAPPAAPVMKSIIEQINDVLQARLAGSPFKDRGIELVEGPDGSVVVLDGLQRYVGVDSIPDAAVQAFIRKSVAEWEKTTR